MFNNDYYITSIIFDKKTKFKFVGLHNFNTNRTKYNQKKDYSLYFDGITDRENVLNLLNNGLYDLTISLDYKFIHDDEIISILKNKNVQVIRIIGDNYSLNSTDYERLNFAKQVLVDEVDSNVKFQKDRVSLEHNIFRKEYKKADNNEITYFVNRLLAPLEISLLVSNIKRSMNTYGNRANYLLSFRLYSIDNYNDILLNLKKYNLPINVKIQFLGNPLEDEKNVFFNMLNVIDNNIEIIYNSSNFVLSKYSNEPYTRFNYYHLEIEAEGICSLNDYINLLDEINAISDYIEGRGYSPLESLIYGYRYLHQNYISSRENESFFNNRKQLSNDEFTNLFSLIMRKNNIKVYKYSTDTHVRNIVLILDYKYKVFKIGIIDPYWDSVYIDSKGEKYNCDSHTFFMISPKDTLRFVDPECLTIGSSLVLNEEIMNRIGNSSRSSYESSINDEYNLLANNMYILNKMGYEITSVSTYYNLVGKLNEKGYFDTLDPNIIKQAIKEVETTENFNINSFDMAKKLHSLEISFFNRNHQFIEINKLLDNAGNINLIELPDKNKIYEKK